MEQLIFKKSITSIIAAAALLLMSFATILVYANKEYKVYVPDYVHGVTNNSIKLEPEGILRSAVSYDNDGHTFVTFSPIKRGRARVTIEGESSAFYFMLKVNTYGIIRDYSNGNFSGYRSAIVFITLFCIALAIIMWINFINAKKVLHYSYQPMFYLGFAVWITVTAIIQASVLIMLLVRSSIWNTTVFNFTNYISILRQAGTLFMFAMTPFLLIFAILMTASNISLIRHEGFRTRNALGIILSLGLILAELLFIYLKFGLRVKDMGISFMLNTILSAYSIAFVFAECLLIGAIYCGISAAKHEPAYDKDYIVILGCAIKKDGTLYPLIKGRVDRAIKFMNSQLLATGKQAILVPSGGQGRDEVCSEAEAMKNYIISQGIDEKYVMPEDKSRNTMENMKFSKQLIDAANPDAKSAFSTTNFHVFRSGIISRQQDFPAEGMGCATKWYFWPNAYMREFVGMIVYCKKRVFVLLGILIALFVFLEWIV